MDRLTSFLLFIVAVLIILLLVGFNIHVEQIADKEIQIAKAEGSAEAYKRSSEESVKIVVVDKRVASAVEKGSKYVAEAKVECENRELLAAWKSGIRGVRSESSTIDNSTSGSAASVR